MILVFIPAVGQFVIPDLLGGAKTAMIGNAVTDLLLNSSFAYAQARGVPWGAPGTRAALPSWAAWVDQNPGLHRARDSGLHPFLAG